MALDQIAQYPIGTAGPSADYPEGEAVNETVLDALDGYPWEKEGINDLLGFQQALLRSSSQAASGSADTALVSQYLQGIIELASGRASTYDDSGVVDAYVLDVQTNQQAPSGLFDGLILNFVPSNDCTAGGCTANPFGQGITDIKLKGGTVDPAKGAIKAGRLTKVIYRTSPGAHLELDRTGQVSSVQVTASGNYTPPDDVRSLEFTVIGAGGGGGGVDGQGAGTAAVSAPGGGGGAAILTTENIESVYAVVIGAGGTGGAAGANDGVDGGATTVISTDISLAGNGGGGGLGMLGVASGFNSGSAGGSAAGGDLNLHGEATNIVVVRSGALSSSCISGASILGGGTRHRVAATGNNANNYGVGGGGTTSPDVTTNYAGGDGADGIVIVKEFF